MDQFEFEQAIAPYTKKEIDDHGRANFIIRAFRRETHIIGSESEKKTRIANSNPIKTPAGIFNSMQEAATSLGVSKNTIYGRIHKSMKTGDKLYEYVRKNDGEDT